MQTIPLLLGSDAMRAVVSIRDALLAHGQTAVIAVADAHGELLAFLRMDGAPLESGVIAINKAFTAARVRGPSRSLGDNFRTKGYDAAWYGDARYQGFGGGMPMVLDGRTVGAVAVSGLSQDEDEEMAAIGIAAALADHG